MAEAQRSPEQTAEVALQMREAYYYRWVAGVLCVAAILFGLLNLWGVIRM